ncbi:PAS domain S-box protein [Daejeonella sp.]|uniref:PAS domain S-box protein n=1 Tax=Daejeonella sp. TaxID=2805397 RepID=UPI003C7559E8
MFADPESSFQNDYNFNILFYESPQPMWIVDSLTLQFLEVNNSAITTYGYSKKEFLSMTIRDILVGGVHKDLDPMDLSGNETYNLESLHQYKNGNRIHAEATVFPFIFNGSRARLSYIRDITAKVKREALLKYLNSAGEELALALNTDAALQRISELIVPKFANWFTINVLRGVDVDLLFVQNPDPEYVSWAKEYRERNPITIDEKGLTGHILRTGESSLVPVVTQEMIEQSITDPEHLKKIMALNLRSSIVVPMKIKNKIIGTINFISTVERKEYDEIDLDFAKDMATRIALALENARLYEEAQDALALAEEADAETQATNEEITAMNEELSASNEQLASAYDRIQESEETFRAMAEDTNVLIAVADESSNGVYFNKAWQEMTGKSAGELLKFGWAELLHPEDKEPWIAKYLAAFEKKESLNGEFRILDKKGDYRWLMARVPARFNSDGSFAGYISSCIDITDMKNDEARKNDFIGMVSHELKTPLTSMMAILQITSKKLTDSQDTLLPGLIDKSINQVRKMTSMISGFLNLSRLESGKMDIIKSKFNFEDLIQEIVAETDLTVSSHRITVDACDSVELNADREKIGTVITNLISNAVKYSRLGTEIILNCKVEGNRVFFSVRDQGVGIKNEDQLRLFDRYFRAESTSAPYISGFGIGLYLSAEIIERHDGKIWVESEFGKGSTFYFSLPLSVSLRV